MPYTAEHKARTREQIVMAARAMFNCHGFDAVSIDDIMKHAGLTRGGFYNHFNSKADLFVEAVVSYVTSSPMHRRMSEQKSVPSAPKIARMLVNLYLSDEILGNSDDHCPLYALPSESVRGGEKPRAAYTTVIRSLEGAFLSAFGPDDRDARRKAQLIVALCVGGMLLARTTNDAALGRSLREHARVEALALLDQAPAKAARKRTAPRKATRAAA
jgi:AcrR family transcriptional regulator